jgi:hypothetical protein
LANYVQFSHAAPRIEEAFASPSLFGLLFGVLAPFSRQSVLSSMEQVYSVVGLAAMAILPFFVMSKIKDLKLRCFYITITIIMFPIASHDYNLVLLLPFLPLLLRTSDSYFSFADLVFLSLVFIPKHYLTVFVEPYGLTALRLTENAVITPLLLGLILLRRFSTINTDRILFPGPTKT